MDELELQEALDRIITRFIIETSTKLIERQTRIETFLSIASLTLESGEIAGLVSETGVVSISLEAMINDATKAYAQSIAAAAQNGVADVQRRAGAEKEWTWQVESQRPCPDCSARSGQTHSYEYWESVGLPREGLTICGSYCLCRLVS